MRLAVLLLIVLIALPSGAAACKCAGSRPACESLFRSSVVFVGTPTFIEASAYELLQQVLGKLPPALHAKVEGGADLTLDEMKQIALAYAPDAASELVNASTEAEVEETVYKRLPRMREGIHRVTFAVEETLRGEELNSRVVGTGSGMGDCGLPFEVGKRYLVYTYEDTESGELETSICTRTRPIEDDTDPELLDLRAITSGVADTRIFGVASTDYREPIRLMYYSDDGLPDSPLVGATVTLRSSGLVLSSTTNAEGRYEFSGLLPGKYSLTIEAAGYSFDNLPFEINLERHACAYRVLAPARAR